MKIRIPSAIVLVLALTNPTAHAQSGYTEDSQRCDSAMVDAMGKPAGMNNFTYRRNDPEGVIISGVCKTSSDDKSITIGAFVSSFHGGSDMLTITMVNNRTYAALASYNESLVNSFTPKIEVGRDMLRLDTARYDIAKGVRAFGLDVIAGATPKQYCGQEDGGIVRTLFMRDGDVVRWLTDEGLPVSFRRYVEGDPRCMPANSPSPPSRTVTEYFHLTISILDKVTDGYADLLITAVSTYSDGRPSLRKPFRSELRYQRSLYDNHDIGFYYTGGLREEIGKWLAGEELNPEQSLR